MRRDRMNMVQNLVSFNQEYSKSIKFGDVFFLAPFIKVDANQPPTQIHAK